ncbi:integral membrane protein [Ilyonectria sp. MPI-CAGE-AT-0026]|nr:integral membrane protein [Ilyonectria sp. MPI-CAGE-AT-0026]
MANDGLSDVPKGGWRASRGWRIPEWVEPVLIVTILFSSMYITRRKNYSIIRQSSPARSHPIQDDSSRHSTPLLDYPDVESPRRSHESNMDSFRGPHPPKARTLCGVMRIQTPNSSRFTTKVHSRILQKFPFLVEMWYWGISFGFYRLTTTLAQWYYGGRRSMWDSAQAHGMYLLDLEASFWGGDYEGPARWLEWRIQRWFLVGMEVGDWRGVWLTILNRGYALIHIPGTVGFIAYYYATAPTHSRFCTVRRTMTVTNFMAFAIFITVPTMPPRLLPEKYGFVDTINLENAESVWMSGDFVNKLAAMPSMHFGYAFCIGAVFMADSGVLNEAYGWIKRAFACQTGDEHLIDDDDDDDDDDGGGDESDVKILAQRSAFTRWAMFAFGLWYPCWTLLTIVATANHYFLDALFATFVVLIAYWCNPYLKVFIPLEDYQL